MTCHTANDKYVLGVKTHQLNGDFYYPSLGRSMNQLDYFNQLGVFRQGLGNTDSYLKSYAIDDESVDLELRIRSYLDANCSSCHRVGGIPNVSLDFRFVVPLRLQNSIRFPTQSQASDPNRLIIKPGDHAASELWVRDASHEDNRMPPIGRDIVDQVYVDSLAKWIDNLSEDAHKNTELHLYPNPCRDWLTIRVVDNWTPPFKIKIYTLEGKVIRQETAQQYSIYLDLADLSTGNYFIEVSAGNDRKVSKLIVQ